MQRKHTGFTLIELLVVVGIIMVLTALAVPRFLRSKMAANEASAVASLRTLLTANITYSTTYGNAYSPDLPSLGGNPPPNCNNANVIDSALASGIKSGYAFTYVLASPVAVPPPGCAPGGNSFTIQATPAAVGSSGQRSFCTDDTTVIRFDLSGALIPAPCSTSGMSALH